MAERNGNVPFSNERHTSDWKPFMFLLNKTTLVTCQTLQKQTFAFSRRIILSKPLCLGIFAAVMEDRLNFFFCHLKLYNQNSQLEKMKQTNFKYPYINKKSFNSALDALNFILIFYLVKLKKWLLILHHSFPKRSFHYIALKTIWLQLRNLTASGNKGADRNPETRVTGGTSLCVAKADSWERWVCNKSCVSMAMRTRMRPIITFVLLGNQ